MNNYILLAVALIAIGAYATPIQRGDVIIDSAFAYKTEANPSYYWGNFTECTKTCGSGTTNRNKYCLIEGTYELCDVEVYECSVNNCYDPFRDQPFSMCSVSCGGGTRNRNSTTGETHTIRCNTQPCKPRFTKCRADIIFVLDSSGSITDNEFYAIKQFTMDVVSALDIAETKTHVGAISFSTRVYNNIKLSEDNNKVTLLNKLWNLPFLAGMTNTADALMEMRTMSDKSSKDKNKQIAIVLTDGHSNIDKSRTIKEAELAHQKDIEVIVIGIGLAIDDKEMLGIASKGRYYSVASVDAIMDITNLIVASTCTSKPKCTPCIYSECTGQCMQHGIKTGTHNCTVEMNGVSISKPFACEEKACIGKCTTTTESTTTTTESTTTTTTTATTPTEKTTTDPLTTPERDLVNCDKCDFTQGQIWRPDVMNCHGYYICDPTTVDGKYRITRMTCGDLYWNQELSTCVRKAQPGCDSSATPEPTVKFTGTTEKPVCTYVTDSKNKRKFTPKDDKSKVQTCPENMHFDDSDTVCTCLPDSGFTDKCKDDMLLHFPYDTHFDDVTCKHAKSVQIGKKEDRVVLVDDAVRGKVAKFNGKGYLEVPFLRKYFAGNTIKEFTVSFFFKKTTDSNGKGTVVSNGDCKEESTFESGYDNGKVYYEGKTVKSEVDINSLSTVSVNVWYHVAWVYNGETLVLYVNGDVVSSKPLSGGLISTDVPMAVGARCGEFYHTGLVDEIQIYARALSADQVKELSKQ